VVQKVQSKKEIHHAHKKNQLPPFLEQNQDVTATIKQYCKEHLGELSVEFVFDYLHHTILPNLVKDIYGSSKEELGDEKYQEALRQVLKPYRLTCISISTVSRWINVLGFKYELRKKGYYVDGHEKPATIEYRKAFCERYLAHEARMHRWVQVKEEVAKALEEKGDITPGSGYYYYDQATQEKKGGVPC
jgi:hypothetical protein